MKYHVIAIRDRALDAYMRPFYVPALGAGVRSFQDEINNKESPMCAHPDDYDLYHLGTWDDQTGEFANKGVPDMIAIGKQLKTTA